MPRRSVLLGGLGVLLIGSAAAAQPPGGPPEPPAPGQVLSPFIQDELKLTPEQKKQVAELQKDIDARLVKILTSEQKKSLQDMRPGPGGFGGFGGFGPPGGFPGGGPPGGFPGGPPGGFGPGGFGGFGPPRVEDVKKQIGASDEEWKVISAKIQKVVAARQALTGDAAFGSPANALSQARADLKAVLDDPKHSKAEVEDKLAEVRKARQKARADLETAQKDLLRLVTAEQEAVLVGLGYLD
jgi:Spy/CpxP family protein refolding chaperone